MLFDVMFSRSAIGDSELPKIAPEITAPMTGYVIGADEIRIGAGSFNKVGIIGMAIGNMTDMVAHDDPMMNAIQEATINIATGKNSIRMIGNNICAMNAPVCSSLSSNVANVSARLRKSRVGATSLIPNQQLEMRAIPFVRA